jgi:Transglycosylase-like domain
LLTKRTYLVPALAAALALPAAAFAAGSAEESIGISKAKPIAISKIAPPVAHFHRTIRVVKRQIAAERRAELRRRRREAFASLPAGVSMATLEAIAACESGGDPAIVSSDGSYRGKYQFDFGTWESVGGSGDPAAAPEAEQDYRAALLYAQSGSSPWPVCG